MRGGPEFLYTCGTLNEWARWSRHSVGGYPSASAHVPRVRGRAEPPERVLVCDAVLVVLGVEEHHLQQRIIKHYQRDCGIREILRQLGISTRRYYDDLEEAQWAVHVRLTS